MFIISMWSVFIFLIAGVHGIEICKFYFFISQFLLFIFMCYFRKLKVDFRVHSRRNHIVTSGKRLPE